MTPAPITVSTHRSPGRARKRVALTALAWRYLLGVERDMSAMVEHDRMMAEMGMTMDMSRPSCCSWRCNAGMALHTRKTVLSIIVLAEKLIPGGHWLARAGGVAMIVAGALRVFVS